MALGRHTRWTLFLIIGIPLGISVRPSPESMGFYQTASCRDCKQRVATACRAVVERSDEVDPTLREAMKRWFSGSS